ncbi:putative RNA-binding protein with TRAM domain [Natrinema hispanicum]|uniref:Putative RNA-binding protein with TRAM domain n=1 Tax=Natrinema hispanicum TaxID=392421 RepID=A0A482Y3X9_9EURY|nr:RNA-binding protein [Natrinema hispanicum]RZV08459.1 putative RNA-binding protein with TRAM domain [Natrinema hispanicum]
MLGPGPETLAVGAFVALLIGSWLFTRVRGGSAGERQSRKRHQEAQQREPPVDIGDVETVAIREFTDHHSGERRAVGKIEGFVIFVEDVPDSCAVTDVIRVKILSFNRGHTSATATYLESA